MSESTARKKVYVGCIKPQTLDTHSKVCGGVFVGRITFKSFGRVGRIKVLSHGCETKT
ncbi:MAG: hypothetical protein QXL27_06265 [Candidatus Bathyarchaeia archaeon]